MVSGALSLVETTWASVGPVGRRLVTTVSEVAMSDRSSQVYY